jgi:hypothetical protein
MCSPHSYSAPQQAVTRSMTISRCRMVRLPRSSRPELKNLKNSFRSRAIVVKSTSGGAPRMIASIASCMSRSSGGDTGAIRALWFL